MKVRIKADVVRERLAQRNLSQNHLAMAAQLSPGYLSQLLSGQRSPGQYACQQLMQALKVSFNEIFVDEAEPVDGHAG